MRWLQLLAQVHDSMHFGIGSILVVLLLLPRLLLLLVYGPFILAGAGDQGGPRGRPKGDQASQPASQPAVAQQIIYFYYMFIGKLESQTCRIYIATRKHTHKIKIAQEL